MVQNAITVSQFNNYIKQIFDAEELLHNISIEGEVYDVSKRRNSVYFKVKDSEASLSCVSFMDIEVTEGEKVVITGRPNYYNKAGIFNFVVSKYEKSGEGDLFKKFIELKEKLKNEGLFDETHKIKIPSDIKRIGVVSSREGAVIRDIINVTKRRNKSVDIVLYDVKVQGNLAENEIAKGIEFLDNYDKVDIIIVARGGGSLQDLWPFNTEIVARATYNCQKPIVSAVGHETDFTIIDFVADLRAPTPSAAAEIVTKDFSARQEKFELLYSTYKRFLFSKESEFLEKQKRLIDDFKLQLENRAKEDITRQKILFLDFEKVVQNKAQQFSFNFAIMLEKFKHLNPLETLDRGYAKLEKDQFPVKSIQDVKVDEKIKIITNFAKIDAKIEKITKI